MGTEGMLGGEGEGSRCGQQNTSFTWTILWKNIDGTLAEKSLKYLKRIIILTENANALEEVLSALKTQKQNFPRKENPSYPL